jgi:hypothetical protein
MQLLPLLRVPAGQFCDAGQVHMPVTLADAHVLQTEPPVTFWNVPMAHWGKQTGSVSTQGAERKVNQSTGMQKVRLNMFW